MLDKNSGQLIINYYRHLYNKKKTYLLEDISAITYRLRSNRGFQALSYNYYLELKKERPIFLTSQGISFFSGFSSKINHPVIIKKIAKYLDVKINKDKAIFKI